MDHPSTAALLGQADTSISEHYTAVSPERLHDERTRASARKKLFATLREADNHADAWRVAAYREYLAATVRQVSPILLDLCRHEAIDLDDIAMRLRPADHWPIWLCGEPPRSNLYYARGLGSNGCWAPPHELIEADRRMVTTSALILRGHDHPAGALAVRPLNTCLEVGLRSKVFTLRTERGRAELRLRSAMPATICAGLPGARVEDIIDHPILQGRGYVVDHASQGQDGSIVVVFHAPPGPWIVPWPRSAEASGV